MPSVENWGGGLKSLLQLATLSPHTRCPALTTDNHSTVCRGMLDTEQRGETFAGVIFRKNRISSAPEHNELQLSFLFHYCHNKL